jgi:hypothetical protein
VYRNSTNWSLQPKTLSTNQQSYSVPLQTAVEISHNEHRKMNIDKCAHVHHQSYCKDNENKNITIPKKKGIGDNERERRLA